MLLVSGLQQQLLSSIEAFARTLKVHRRTVERRAAADPKQSKQAVTPSLLDLLAAPIGADDDRATLTPEQLERDEESQIEAATDAALGASTDEGLALLDEMTEIAEMTARMKLASVGYRWRTVVGRVHTRATILLSVVITCPKPFVACPLRVARPGVLGLSRTTPP